MICPKPAHSLRLREKLLIQGSQSLSDEELLAVFISSGNAKKSCLQLAFDLIKQLGDLRAVLNADVHSFRQVAGLGVVRYLQLQAAQEMCRRSDFINLQKDLQLTNSQQTYDYLRAHPKKGWLRLSESNCPILIKQLSRLSVWFI